MFHTSHFILLCKMNKTLYIENSCMEKIHNYIETLLNKKIYTQHYYFQFNILFSDFENIKPFLQKINKKLYFDFNRHLDEISLDDLNQMNNNIQYLFYIVKGYQLTREIRSKINSNETNYYKKQPDAIKTDILIGKLLKIINRFKRNARLKKKIVKWLYIDNYTKRKFYKNILNYIISYV